MTTEDSFDELIIHGDEELIGEMSPLLQFGFSIRVPTPTSLREILLFFGLSNEFIDISIRTIFRNSQPVDDIDRTCISDGDEVGLSGAMPGLVGATLRSGSHLAAYRSNISLEPEEIPNSQEEGFVRLRVFNVVLREAGELFLVRGIYLKNTVLTEFLRGKDISFFDHCKRMTFNNKEVELSLENSDNFKFSSNLVFLRVKKT